MSLSSKDPSILYEVIVEVTPNLREKFVSYMTGKHIADVLATGCFVKAEFSESHGSRFRTAYRAIDENRLNIYLSEYASALREDFLSHFPEEVSVSRETWRPLFKTPSETPLDTN